MVTSHVGAVRQPAHQRSTMGCGAHSYLGLPATYPDTPIELIDLGDVARLVDALVIATGGKPAEPEL